MENMDFKQFITEAPEKTAAFAFGRFNPPTVGHEKLINKVKSVADEHHADAHIVASHSEGTSKDPLPVKAKIGYLKHLSSEDTKVSAASKESPSFLHIASKLHSQGYKHLIMVAGSDRTSDFESKLKKYNNVAGPHGHYNFKSIKVVSAGQRDPDAEGVEGMSGSKMRAHARAGETKQFKSGLPKVLHSHAEEITNHIKAVKEDFENPHRHDWGTPEGTRYMQKMTPGQDNTVCPSGSIWNKDKNKCIPIREAYHAYEIFNLGNVVESKNGTTGVIVYRGPSYITMQLENGSTVKQWINDIKNSDKIMEIKEFSRSIKENRNLRKIPALLMSKSQLAEMHANSMEIEYAGYQTHNLHMCPGASKQLQELVRISKADPKYIVQAIKASDNYLGIEKEAITRKFADDKMVHDFNMNIAIAHDTLNMLGYTDDKLKYMEKHNRVIAKLSMHKDETFANEPGSTVTTYGAGMAEGVVRGAATSRIPVRKSNGEMGWRDIHRTRILNTNDTDGKMNTDKKTDDQIQLPSTKKALSDLKKSLGIPVVETYIPDPPTATRDINASSNKEVYHGIDMPITDQGYPDKPLGLVSFKTFFDTPETKKIEAERGKDMQSVHRDKAELAIPSPAYKQMKKAHTQGVD